MNYKIFPLNQQKPKIRCRTTPNRPIPSVFNVMVAANCAKDESFDWRRHLLRSSNHNRFPFAVWQLLRMAFGIVYTRYMHIHEGISDFVVVVVYFIPSSIISIRQSHQHTYRGDGMSSSVRNEVDVHVVVVKFYRVCLTQPQSNAQHHISRLVRTVFDWLLIVSFCWLVARLLACTYTHIHMFHIHCSLSLYPSHPYTCARLSVSISFPLMLFRYSGACVCECKVCVDSIASSRFRIRFGVYRLDARGYACSDVYTDMLVCAVWLCMCIRCECPHSAYCFIRSSNVSQSLFSIEIL